MSTQIATVSQQEGATIRSLVRLLGKTTYAGTKKVAYGVTFDGETATIRTKEAIVEHALATPGKRVKAETILFSHLPPVKGPLVLTSTAEGIKASHGVASFAFQVFEQPTFYASDWQPGKEVFEVKISLRALETAAVAALRDDDRAPVLQTVSCQYGRIVATDSYRLIILDAPEFKHKSLKTGPWNLPALAVRLARAIGGRSVGDVTIRFHEMAATMTVPDAGGGEWAVTVPREKVPFPDTDRLTPHPTSKLRLADSATVLAALAETTGADDKDSKAIGTPVRFNPDGRFSYVAHSATYERYGLFEWDTECRLLAFNRTYLTDGLRVVGDRSTCLTIEIEDNGKPVVIDGETPDGRGVRYLLMPVRIS